MIIPDANVLIYSYDSSAPHQHAARRWWESTLSGDEAVGIPVIVLLAFVRLMTHPTLCENPMTVAQVRVRVDAWLAADQVRLLSPSSTTINHMLRLLEHAGTGGNLTTDALIAAHALESGGRVLSNDADFARFSGVVWENPLAG
jgi:toxin-antitoxin system PIN domain toxin